jgi:hypothetical protein
MLTMKISIGTPTSALLSNQASKSTIFDHLLAILLHIISRLNIEVIYQGSGKFNFFYEFPIRVWFLIALIFVVTMTYFEFPA